MIALPPEHKVRVLERRKIVCSHCEHAWKTASKYLFVTCPNCMRKVHLEQNLVEASPQDYERIDGV